MKFVFVGMALASAMSVQPVATAETGIHFWWAENR